MGKWERLPQCTSACQEPLRFSGPCAVTGTDDEGLVFAANMSSGANEVVGKNVRVAGILGYAVHLEWTSL